MREISNSYDCLVVGGGPAGSTVAALVAESGASTLLAEREKMPRFHVGESLMPETYWTLKRLGVLGEMKHSQFVKKVSVQFVSHKGNESVPFFFPHHDPRECSQTWQVERSKFDKMLFENATRKGAHCVDQARVMDVVFDGESAAGARIKTVDEGIRDIQARVVVDATGQQAIISNRLGLKVENPRLRKAAVWSYFRNAYRVEGDHGGATVILHTDDKQCWFWFIPLSENVTSVGVVGDRDHLMKSAGGPSGIFADQLVKCPSMQCRLHGAICVDDQYHVAKEFSYSTSKSAGDGWVLVGDAFGFIDPIYSSGVYFALKSGEMAADCIIEGFSSGDLSGQQLGKWIPEFRTATQWVQKLVAAFYTHEFSFGQFMKNHPQHQGNLTDLLIGRIFQPAAGLIFRDMDPWLEQLNRSDPGKYESQI